MRSYFFYDRIDIMWTNPVRTVEFEDKETQLFWIYASRQVANPRTNELYNFSRHGHHLQTKDSVTGRVLYAFLSSVVSQVRLSGVAGNFPSLKILICNL